MSKSKIMVIKLNKIFNNEEALKQRASGAWRIKRETIIDNNITHVVVMYHQMVIADYCLGKRIAYHVTGPDKGRIWFDLESYKGTEPLKGKTFAYKTANPATTIFLSDLLDLEVTDNETVKKSISKFVRKPLLATTKPLSNLPDLEIKDKETLKEKIVSFIRQPIPDNIGVINQSVPVIFFGNIETAHAATISLNPSDLEFRNHKQQLLPLDKKRFVDRDVLNKKDRDTLTIAEAEKVYQSFINYFNNLPYKTWFNQLNRIISPLGFSYFEDSLIHLDITPWATYPKWANLTTKQEILTASQNISDHIIRHGKLKYLFINGISAFNHVKSYYDDIKIETTETVWLASRNCTIYTGQIGNCRFIAWSLYAQAALKVDDRLALTSEINQRL